MLKLSKLSVRYGSTQVIDQLDLEMGKDEILMLVGPTGCGKTTILQAVAGLIPIHSGEIQLGDWTANAKQQVAPEKRRIGMVFQDFALFPHMSVERNVNFRLSDPAPANHWIELLGLNELRHKKPANLSGGQKQRVALARTLAHEPKLVLLDEPLSNLDAALKDSVRWEIRMALKDAGVPAIWVTHDRDEALTIGDRLGVLSQGTLSQLDSPEACFSQPRSRFVARFLGDASFLRGEFKDGIVHTQLGQAPGMAIDGEAGEVDLLVRPDDFSISPTQNSGNGQVIWTRYEGGSRLFAVRLDDGTEIKVRSSHENTARVNDRVELKVTTTHPLAAFKP